jgi:alpha-tubulin suppressor-like RCC1 family protein
VGGGYACGVNTDDQAYCWGNNKNSQLGNGNSTSQKTPTLVLAGEIPINNKIISLSVSKDDTISSSVLVTCAIVDNGKAYCWGNNSKGQLGINSTTNKNIPTQVFTSESDSSSAITNNTILTSISAGSTYVCALDSMGNTYCWGNNNLGQLGIGSLSQKKTAQLVITGGSSAIPVGVGLQSVIAGYDNGITTPVSQPALTCGLGTDNNFYCWGDNKAGQVGVNTSVRYYSSAQKVLLP